jgi:hypothetical protein
MEAQSRTDQTILAGTIQRVARDSTRRVLICGWCEKIKSQIYEYIDAKITFVPWYHQCEMQRPTLKYVAFFQDDDSKRRCGLPGESNVTS